MCWVNYILYLLVPTLQGKDANSCFTDAQTEALEDEGTFPCV